MQEQARAYRAVSLDFGTGDGRFVLAEAAREPDWLHIGVDAIADNLRRASRRAPKNAFLGRLALADAPGELVGLGDRLTVLFPWGGLLEAVAGPDPNALARLRGLLRPGATIRFLFEHSDAPDRLLASYADAGLRLTARPVPVEEARALPTTWAKKLGYSGRPRRFFELTGRAL